MKSTFEFVENINLENETLEIVDCVLDDPWTYGGVKRIHIGDPGIKVDSKNISDRSVMMQKVGYDEHDYFIEFNNNLFDVIARQLKSRYNLSYEHHCAIIVDPGQCMPVHEDTYAYLMKCMTANYLNMKYDLQKDSRRYVMFLTEWEPGQCFGGQDIIKGNWYIGDVFTWHYKLLHWCSNSSMKPMMFFEITGLEL